MNARVAEQIRDACIQVRSRGVRIQRGSWFTFGSDNTVLGCCAIGAVLLVNHREKPLADLSRPGYVRTACELLYEDPGFLHRFWMGFDRNFQVTIVKVEKDKREEYRDDVSAFGMQLAREFAVL